MLTVSKLVMLCSAFLAYFPLVCTICRYAYLVLNSYTNNNTTTISMNSKPVRESKAHELLTNLRVTGSKLIPKKTETKERKKLAALHRVVFQIF